MREELAERFMKQGVPPQDAQAEMAAIESDPSVGPNLDAVVRTANVPADMKMDITVETVPDVANMQQEQFDALVALAPAVTFPPQVYIKASTIRNKRELLDELQQSASNPAQEQAATLEMDKTRAEIAKIKAETLSLLAKADQTDAQTGQIVNPQIVEANGAQVPMPPQGPEQAAPPQF